MPDMCYIEIDIPKSMSGIELETAKVRLLDEFGNINYNKVIPIPTNILNWAYNDNILAAASLYYDRNPDKLKNWEFYMLFQFEDDNREVKIIRNGKEINQKHVLDYYANQEDKHANLKINSFFDWCVDNWDTKWSGVDVQFTHNTLVFANPYGMPNQRILDYIMRTLCEVAKVNELTLYVDIEASDYEYEFRYQNDPYEFEETYEGLRRREDDEEDDEDE